MARALRVLIAEDNPSDAELVLRELRRAGFEPDWHRVETEAAYLERLPTKPDIILSDFQMPQFSGPRALELLTQTGANIPFIIISGTIGEDIAVDMMKRGAADYLMKDRLTRLGPAVQQALDQARLEKERRQTEDSLRQSEAEFRAMTEASPLGIFVTDCEGMLTYTNATLRQMLGVGFQEISGSGWFQSVHPEDRNPLLDEWRSSIAQRQNFKGCARFVRRDGAVIWASIRSAAMRGDEQVLGYVGVVEDITERKRSEERIREQAEMLDCAHEAIIVRDIHTRRISFWNKGAERLYGWTSPEAEGRDIGELIFADAKSVDDITRELLQAGESHGERRHVTKHGGKLIVSSHVTLVKDNAGNPKSALVINIDITKQKNLETQFLRAQRMESIGTLASGVAHDLNNILAPILMSAPILRQEMPAAERDGIISTIELSAERGAQIVKQVLTLGRGLEGERRPIQVSAIIKEMVKIMRGTFPKDILIETTIAPDLWPAIGDATQIHQIVLNLCVNARDAMPDGGRLLLRASNIAIDANYASAMADAKPGPHVLLEVRDNGSGIAPEIVERIFDPFFTTKAAGKGTGLGLSTVLGIVQSHGGHINLASQPGEGTSFQIYLPASPEQQAGFGVPNAAATLPRGNGECMLVVDDEEAIRNAIRSVLESHGYRVMTATDGVEALAVFARNPNAIHGVLTDLMMPLMDGTALIHALRKLEPGLPIIASTGLGEKARLAGLKAIGITNILTKPYGAAELLQTVNEALHPAASGSHTPAPTSPAS